MNTERDFGVLEKTVEDKKKDMNKAFHIRNLKVVGSVGRILLPYMVASTITLSAYSSLGVSPMGIDKTTKSKLYQFEYKAGEILKEEGYYHKFSLFDEELPDNKLIVYTPWEQNELGYTRVKREYDIKNDVNNKLKEAIISKDMQYLEDHLDNYKEEKITTNKLNENVNNDYSVDTYFHYYDKKDTIEVDESAFSYLMTMIGYFSISTFIGYLFDKKINKKFDFMKYIKEQNEKYKEKKNEYIEESNKLKRFKRKAGDQ